MMRQSERVRKLERTTIRDFMTVGGECEGDLMEREWNMWKNNLILAIWWMIIRYYEVLWTVMTIPT